MNNPIRGRLCLYCLGFLTAVGLNAQDITLRKGESESRPAWLALPYAFSSETWDIALGAGGGGIGWPTPQAITYGAFALSTNDTWSLILGGVGYPGLISERLFVDPFATYASYTNLQVYVPGNPAFTTDPDRAGSNGSDPENFFRESADDTWFQATFRYILPLGDNAGSPFHTYVIDRGMLAEGATGGAGWNPLASGRTSLLVRPYYRNQDVTIPLTGSPYTFETLNVQVGLEYDNRDFRANPSEGTYQMVALTRDWGALGETDAWTFGEVELAAYFNLRANDTFRQQVIGLNAWTGHSFTWEERQVEGLAFPVAVNRPPYYTGATLGGLNRMRGFPSDRFNGRSVVYYSAEYRVIPRWTPFSFGGIDETLEMDWWQISVFAEAGRVADDYDLGELHSDMQGDIGVDLRFMIRKAVVRIGLAVSDEAIQVAAMFGQPF